MMKIPPVSRIIGKINSSDIKLYISEEVLGWIDSYAKSDTAIELGSFLIGEYLMVDESLNVLITGVEQALYTKADAASLTFTHDTWKAINDKMEELHSSSCIIGWQHTHPGFGVFLSEYDMFIQENFFDLPFQIAYVVDPVKNSAGFFQWKNGKVEPLTGYFVI